MERMRRIPVVLALVLGVLAATFLAGAVPAAAASSWQATWGAAQQVVADPTRGDLLAVFPAGEAVDQSMRFVVRTTVGGESVRVRFSNRFGTEPLEIGAARIALRDFGATVLAGTSQVVTWSGSPSTVIPPGVDVVSDPVPLQVFADNDLLVSLYLPGRAPLRTYHSFANTTSYVSEPAAGNLVDDQYGGGFSRRTGSWFWLSEVDVQTDETIGTVAVIGDSLTDGSGSRLAADTGGTWPRALADRLRPLPGTYATAVVNHGIGFGTVNDFACATCGPPVRQRFGTETLYTAGLTHVVVFAGTNDIARRATATQVIQGLRQVVREAKARGLRVIGVTIPPRHDAEAGWHADTMESVRFKVNWWIRHNAGYDGVLDADAVLRDPSDRSRLRAAYDSGDHRHPNRAGLAAVAAAANLEWFRS